MKKISTLVIIMLSLQLVWGQSSEELFIKSSDSLKLSGTLLMPSKVKGDLCLAIIIAGSGPTDRDGNNMMMKNNSLKDLAEGLSKNKIASYRYDKRAVGKSLRASIKEENLRFEDYINDVKALIKYFKNDSRFSSIVLIGHSEGSLIGMVAAQNTDVDKYISIAGVGRTADLILKDQLREQYGIKNISPIIDSLKLGYMVANLGKFKSIFRPSVQPYMISWFKYNPQVEIQKLSCPTLILQGDNDIQVKVSEAELLYKSKSSAEYKIISGMNHVLKIIKGDFNANLKSYYNSDISTSKVLIKVISKFILNNSEK